MGTQPEANAPPDRYQIDLWPDDTMPEKCAKITTLIRDGYELGEVVFHHVGGQMHAQFNLVMPEPNA